MNDGGQATHMSLRDWFAGQALLMAAVMASSRQGFGESPEQTIGYMVEASYVVADAMLKERERVR